jgi:dephospho-CoA kinase
MIKIGITGGIGSGKTTVCKIFEVLGIPIYYADDRAKELLESDKNVIKKVKNIFGHDVYNEQGKLDRHRVATIVFNFPEILAEYNAIIHPAVFQDVEKWMLRHTQHDYVIKEAALLFETGSYKMLDKIICVTAPVEKRIERVMLRDKVTEEQVRARMQNQWSDAQKTAMSDYIIYNDGSTPLIRQVLSIHEKILIYAKM